MGRDGYSTSREKRGGGRFRSEAVIKFNYTNFDKSLDQANKFYAEINLELN